MPKLQTCWCFIDSNLTSNMPAAGQYQESGRPTVESAEFEVAQQQWQHQRDVTRRLADQSTPEGHILHKAYHRISQLVDELKLDERCLELAQEVCSSLDICNATAHVCMLGV